MKRVILQRQLFTLAIAGVLPLAILAGAGLHLLFEQRRGVEQARALEVTRALATAVEAELQRSLAALQILAVSGALDRGEHADFDDVARRVLATQPGWRNLTLSDVSGRMVDNSDFPAGAEMPQSPDPAAVAAVAQSGKAAIGNLVKGRRGWSFALRVPIVRDGKVHYVVSAIVDPSSIATLLQRQRVPEDWVLSVFDAKSQRVARSKAHERFIATPPTESMLTLMSSPASEGAARTMTLEGDEVFTAYSKVPTLGWTVAAGLPVAAVQTAAVESVVIYGIAVVLSIVFGMVAAHMVARGVNRPIAKLREAADALGRGGQPDIPATDIQELHEVGEAIAKAARQRHAFEAEREDLLRREQQARSQAEAANQAKDQFLAMLGHELRNPLAALSNAASLLGQSAHDSRIAIRAREVIQRQVAHLARLTDDLLDAARALLGKIELRAEPLDLAALTAEALNTLASTGRSTHHRLIPELREAWVRGDPVRLDQIVCNLLINAVKYTPAGGSIHVSTARVGDESRLVVADDGAGMSPELAARAFDLFVQGERDLDRSQGGLGIGLTLVRRLAELHGGRAEVKSEGEGKGSTFSVTFPAIERPPRREPAVAPATAEMLPRTILVVEDSDDARETLVELLRIMGHRVDSAPDGVAGLDKALAIGPDVALVDIGLPGIDGFELARRLRAAEGHRTYLVALTGYGAAEDRRRAMDAGFDAHMTKPVQQERLGELLARARPAPVGADPFSAKL
jgi:signal transduction histidine kinase/ActR/RegA family two-component response regulator